MFVYSQYVCCRSGDDVRIIIKFSTNRSQKPNNQCLLFFLKGMLGRKKYQIFTILEKHCQQPHFMKPFEFESVEKLTKLLGCDMVLGFVNKNEFYVIFTPQFRQSLFMTVR